MKPRNDMRFGAAVSGIGYMISVIMDTSDARTASLFLGMCIFLAAMKLMDHADGKGG
jgi:Na+-transporting NADH:ubiquinone oxidoreductase subunit NqrE